MRRVSELDDDSENDIEIGDHADDEVLLPSTTRDVDLEDEMGFNILSDDSREKHWASRKTGLVLLAHSSLL